MNYNNTFPSFETTNSDFEPPTISVGLRTASASLKVGRLIFDPFNPPS